MSNTGDRTPHTSAGFAPIVSLFAAIIGFLASLVVLAGIISPEIGATLGFQTITPQMMFGAFIIMTISVSVNQGLRRAGGGA